MSKDISTIKYDKTINLDEFIVNPEFLKGTTIRFERVKADPGAVYISICTSGGMLGVFRYAYEGEALKNISKDFVHAGYKIKTVSDETRVVIGNYKHNESAEKGTNELLNDIFSVLATSAYTMTPHTADGFMMLVHERVGGGYRDDLPEPTENYNEDIAIECVNIRQKDEAVISLISAINLWGNRVGVSFNTYFYDHGGHMTASSARAIYSNPGVCELFLDMDKMQMDTYALDRMSAKLALMLYPKNKSVPQWVAFGGQTDTDRKNRFIPYDDPY